MLGRGARARQPHQKSWRHASASARPPRAYARKRKCRGRSPCQPGGRSRSHHPMREKRQVGGAGAGGTCVTHLTPLTSLTHATSAVRSRRTRMQNHRNEAEDEEHADEDRGEQLLLHREAHAGPQQGALHPRCRPASIDKPGRSSRRAHVQHGSRRAARRRAWARASGRGGKPRHRAFRKRRGAIAAHA